MRLPLFALNSCSDDAGIVRFPSYINHSPLLESWTKREDTGEVEARAITPCGSGNPNMVPECLQPLYGIPTAPATQSGNQLAVTGYDMEYAQQADLVVWQPLCVGCAILTSVSGLPERVSPGYQQLHDIYCPERQQWNGPAEQDPSGDRSRT